jgi:hypothetical protein
MKYIVLILTILLSGCGITDKPEVKKIFQTQSAGNIDYDYSKMRELIVEYKEKLDKRNPNSYSKELEWKINTNIKNSIDTVTLYDQSGKKLKFYNEYLNYAFSKESIQNRNDYLIVGLYKMVYEAFSMDKSHKITAFNHDQEKLQKAYKNLQILQWKIKSAKSDSGEYLFLTWQNNWQVDLLKISNNQQITVDQLNELSSIKNGSETLFDSSNSSFEILTDRMLLYLEHTLTQLGVEPVKLSIDILSTIIFII